MACWWLAVGSLWPFNSQVAILKLTLSQAMAEAMRGITKATQSNEQAAQPASYMQEFERQNERVEEIIADAIDNTPNITTSRRQYSIEQSSLIWQILYRSSIAQNN